MYIDKIMNEIKDSRSFKSDKRMVENYQNDRRTLRQYLKAKKKSLNLERELFSKHIKKVAKSGGYFDFESRYFDSC